MGLKTILFSLLLCCLCCLWQHSLQAQQSLDLYKRGSKKHYYFQAGDSIRLGLRNKQELKAVWSYGGDNAILLGDSLVQLKDVSWVDLAGKNKEHAKWNVTGNAFLIGGAAYFAIDQVNKKAFGDGEFSVNRNVTLASGGLIAVGIMCKVFAGSFKSNKARIGKKYRIYLVDYSSN